MAPSLYGSTIFLILTCSSLAINVVRKNKRTRTAESFTIVIHGGAGVISKKIESQPYYEALRDILQETFSFASSKDGMTALDVVEFGVMLLENNPLFNAGKGSVYTTDGTHELEASIMDGRTLQCGAVSLIKRSKNPVQLARRVMEQTDHIYLIGESAEDLAKPSEHVDQAYFHTQKRWDQLQAAKKEGIVARDHDVETNETKDMSSSGLVEEKGTVGCVCMYRGHVAAATSTGLSFPLYAYYYHSFPAPLTYSLPSNSSGGLTNKRCGRIGDTPLIGAGTYANDRTCAVSTTGKGEEFIRYTAAADVSARMEIGRLSLAQAAWQTVFRKLPKGSGGLIAVDCRGNVAMEFNSKGMFRGVCHSNGKGSLGIWKDMVPFHFVSQNENDIAGMVSME